MALELETKKIAIVGAGNMGVALMKGLMDGGAKPENIVVTTKRESRGKALAETHGVEASSSNAEAVAGADLVILSVKPQVFAGVLEELRGVDSRHALFISVAAGVTTETIQSALGEGARVVRAMPNTPALVNQSATAIAPGRHASPEDLQLAEAVLAKIGTTVIVEEKHLDAVTGLAGSGPAYVMLIIEAFSDAGVKVGLPREIAQALAVQTIRGSAALLLHTGEHPAKLKDQVTSPGGTTIAGLHAMEQGGLRTTIINAVESATNRAKELGKA